MKLNNAQFVAGQQAYAQNLGLRAIVEQANALEAANVPEDEGVSLVLGFLDGLAASIKNIESLLGRDK